MLLAVMTIVDSALAMYDTKAGRFLQHDPRGVQPASQQDNRFSVHGQYADSANLYECVASLPIRFLDPFGLRRTNWQCCKEARDLGLVGQLEKGPHGEEGIVQGALICCDGRLVPCTMEIPKAGDASKDWGNTLILACTRVHERDHMRNAIRCPKCGISRAAFYGNWCVIEFMGYTRQLECLERYQELKYCQLSHISDPAACEASIEAEKKRVEKRRKLMNECYKRGMG